MSPTTDTLQKFNIGSDAYGLNGSDVASVTPVSELDGSSHRASSQLNLTSSIADLQSLKSLTQRSTVTAISTDINLGTSVLNGVSTLSATSAPALPGSLSAIAPTPSSADRLASFGVGVSTTSSSKLLTSDPLLNGGQLATNQPGSGVGSLPSGTSDAGNTLATALNLGTLGSLYTHQQAVNNTDPNDIYRVSVTNGSLNVAVVGMTGDADVRVIRDANSNNVIDAGEVLQWSTRVGTSDESINLSELAAGNYFIDVYRYSTNSTGYTLRLSNSNPNALMTRDNDLGTLSGVRTVGGTMSRLNTSDVYAFNLSTASNLNVAMTGMSNDADLRLIRDSNSNGVVDSGEAIAFSMRGGAADETINLASMAAGNYLMQVNRYSGDTSYTLRLSNAWVNDLLPRETNVGTLSGTRVFSGTTSSTNTADVYGFSLAAPASAFNLTVSGMSSDADVRLIRDANNNGVMDSGEALSFSTASGSAPEIIRQSLAAGNYFVTVSRFSGDTNYNLTLSTGDWYNQNFTDAGMIGQLRSLYYTDGSLSRSDMMSLLRETKDYAAIDATELTELRRVVNAATGFSMPEHVRNLANKVVNGDAANPRSGIGNLFAGSTDVQMERLLGKWFQGTDRPIATGTYRYVSGSLFQNGISVNDVRQGAVGDCYLIATLGSFANDRSSVIQNMFIDNGDGTFTVRFVNNGVADYVTVDRFLPTYADGTAVYQGWGGGVNTSSTNELWVALAEKAYAQVNQSGWIGRDNTNSYAGLNGGWMAPVMRQITGGTANSFSVNSMTQSQLINLVNGSTPITAGFVSGGGFGVVNEHAYTITSYNATTGRFRLHNPWGNTHTDVTWNELRALSAWIEWSV